MSLEAQLTETLKTAMRSKNRPLLNLVRMLKTKMTEKTTKGGFSGEVDDALWLEVIMAYEKSQKKALLQYEEIGELLGREDWPRARLVQFCAYFARHVGTEELKVLHLFV